MRQLRIHTGHVRAVAYAPDGTWIVSAGNDYTVRLIDPVRGKVIRKWIDLGRVMSSVTISPSGTLVVAAGASLQLELIDPEDSSPTPLLIPRSTPPHGRMSVTNVSSLGFSSDGKRFFAGIGDRSSWAESALHLWKCSTDKEWSVDRAVAVPASVWSGAFAPDGSTFALGTNRGWRFCAVSPWVMGGVQTRGPGAKALAWSPDGRTLAVASGHSIILVHAETEAIRNVLTGHAAPIMALAFTPDGQRLLSGGWDQNVRVWDPHLAVPIATFDWQRGKVHCIAVAPDGMTAAAACDKGIVLWDLDD